MTDRRTMSPHSLSQELFAEVHALTAASLSGDIRLAETARLEQLLQDRAAIDLYLELVWEAGTLDTWAKFQRPKPAVAKSPVLGFLSSLPHYAQETPAANALMWLVMAVLCSGMVLTVFFCIVLVFRGVGVNVHVNGPDAGGLHVASSNQEGTNAQTETRFSPSLPLPQSSTPSLAPTVARLINAYDCRWATGSHSPHVGDDLEVGRKLVLTAGFAEVMYQSGVRALLEGPAAMEIESRGALLRMGKLTVRVEDSDARGFEIHAPGMKYTDLGTEFGVSVAKDGTQEMVVFQGKVRAEAVKPEWESGGVGEGETSRSAVSPSPPPSLSTSSTLIVTANQAVHVESVEKSKSAPAIELVAASEDLFVRPSAGLEPFPLFGTGVGLDGGAADRHWEIVDASMLRDFRPQAAVVLAHPTATYVHGSRAKGQWIALTAKTDNYPENCRWMYRTKVDLTGFDPNSARIEGRFAADNFLVEVRLNGRRLPVADRGGFTEYHPIKIERGFVAGMNTLELVILNDWGDDRTHTDSPMGLCVDWKGTARRVPMRE